MASEPVIDRETVEMLLEMDDISSEDGLLIELIDEFLVHSAKLVADIRNHAMAEAQSELTASSHSLKGASLNIGALVLFQVCDTIETLARKHELIAAIQRIPELNDAFDATQVALTELRERTTRGEMIDDLLSVTLLQ